MHPKLLAAAKQLLSNPSQNSIGLYLYPASYNDLTPFLLLHDKNPFQSRLATIRDFLGGSATCTTNMVIPVLCDCEEAAVLPELFANQPHPELWKHFRTTVTVSAVSKLPLAGGWFLAIADFTRAGIPSSHPFIFVKQDAHKLFALLHPQCRFDWLAMIACSGFSGGPTGECSRTISRQIAKMPRWQQPRRVVCDAAAAIKFERLAGHRYVRDNQHGLRGRGDRWGRASVFTKVECSSDGDSWTRPSL